MEKAPSVTGGAQRKIPVRDVQRTRNLSVHPLKVDSMNELQSIAVRLKTPIAIIQRLRNAEAPGAHGQTRARGSLGGR